MNAYDRRRQERFNAAGVTDADVRFAKVSYVGEGATMCGLCDHPEIKYIYRLAFARPGNYVQFEPVGSKCIVTWARALPASAERDALVADVEKADREARAAAREAKARKLREESERAHKAEAPAAKELLAIYDRPASYHRAGLSERDAGTLDDIAERVRRFGLSSVAQRDFFADLLRRAGAQDVPADYGRPTPTRRPTAAPPPPPPLPVPPVAPPAVHRNRRCSMCGRGFGDDKVTRDTHEDACLGGPTPRVPAPVLRHDERRDEMPF